MGIIAARALKLHFIDGLWTSVGSANFDNSFRINDEASLNIMGPGIATAETQAVDAERRDHGARCGNLPAPNGDNCLWAAGQHSAGLLLRCAQNVDFPSSDLPHRVAGLIAGWMA